MMKITIGTVILAGGNVVNEQPYDLKINNSRQIQIAFAMRAAAIRGFDRGNQQTTLEFKVSKRHSSVEEAQAYAIQHAASLTNLSSTLVITEEPSQDTYLLNDAVIGEIQSVSDGIVSSHAYKIIGGIFIKS
ncbi:MAG: hypothetical protein LBB16_00405 [Puniceicoccales bacterium]|jgi:hypothetical protein|nr:hypothetical protein [Puniceicoccales bacterium]